MNNIVNDVMKSVVLEDLNMLNVKKEYLNNIATTSSKNEDELYLTSSTKKEKKLLKNCRHSNYATKNISTACILLNTYGIRIPNKVLEIISKKYLISDVLKSYLRDRKRVKYEFIDYLLYIYPFIVDSREYTNSCFIDSNVIRNMQNSSSWYFLYHEHRRCFNKVLSFFKGFDNLEFNNDFERDNFFKNCCEILKNTTTRYRDELNYKEPLIKLSKNGSLLHPKYLKMYGFKVLKEMINRCYSDDTAFITKGVRVKSEKFVEFIDIINELSLFCDDIDSYSDLEHFCNNKLLTDSCHNANEFIEVVDLKAAKELLKLFQFVKANELVFEEKINCNLKDFIHNIYTISVIEQSYMGIKDMLDIAKSVLSLKNHYESFYEFYEDYKLKEILNSVKYQDINKVKSIIKNCDFHSIIKNCVVHSIPDNLKNIIKMTKGLNNQSVIIDTLLYLSNEHKSRLNIDCCFQNLGYFMKFNNFSNFKPINFTLLENEQLSKVLWRVSNNYQKFNMSINYEELDAIREFSDIIPYNEDFYCYLSTMKSHNRAIKYKEFATIINALSYIFSENFAHSKGTASIVVDYMRNVLNRRGLADYLGKSKSVSKQSEEYYLMITNSIFHYLTGIEISLFELKDNINVIKLNDKNIVNFFDRLKEFIQNDESIDFDKNGVLFELKELLSVNDEFIQNHLSECVKFCISDEYKIFKTYMHNNNAIRDSKRNLVLVTIGLILGKYESLKYSYEDIKLEVGYDISEKAFETWKRTDIKNIGEFKLEDTGDYKTIMTIGKYPVSTCMHYRDGMYSQCLISNFDSCKKILKIYKNGQYIARAILRLTVATNSNLSNSGNVLKFKNYADATIDENMSIDTSKELVLFVERIYTSEYNKKQEMIDAIVEFFKDKIKDIDNAKLIIADAYSYNLDKSPEKFLKKKCYIQISMSKNGSQYMDSLNGCSTTVNQLTYCKGTFDFYNSEQKESVKEAALAL